MLRVFLGALLVGLASAADCSPAETSQIIGAAGSCALAEDQMACAKPFVEKLSLSETCKACLERAKILADVTLCATSITGGTTGELACGGDTDCPTGQSCCNWDNSLGTNTQGTCAEMCSTSGGGTTGGTTGGMPGMPGADQIGNMLKAMCKMLPKIEELQQCGKPVQDLISDPSCAMFSEQFGMGNSLKEGLGELTGILGGGKLGRRLFGDLPSNGLAELKDICDQMQNGGGMALGRRLLEDMEMDEMDDLFDFEKMTEDAVEGMCEPGSCMPKFFAALEKSMTCLGDKMPVIMKEVMDAMKEAMPAGMTMPGDTNMPSFDSLKGMMMEGIKRTKSAMAVICTKSAKGDYCIKKFNEVGKEMEATLPSAEDVCPVVMASPCCVGTMHDFMSKNGDAEMVDEIKKVVKDMCKVQELPKPCAKGGETVKYVEAKLALKGVTFDKVQALSEKTKQKVSFGILQDLAKHLGCDTSELEVKNFVKGANGEFEVQVRVRPSTKSEQEVRAKLDEAKQKPMDKTAELMVQAQVLTEASALTVGDDVSSQETTVVGAGTDEAQLTASETSPASAVGPSLAAAALVFAAVLY